ncbi:hypothetical protein TARUN_6537 [Trichoderma arundinaceum]|uniref:Peptidase S8/S53 domain-containing protein n=1 Tax=Trichoderma arundinaceum TaxID=490622 RepID=A0A395NI60_TRIAR|nr:hypothetical protein TARUN_6537 [Trichoderma arundinaceum]
MPDSEASIRDARERYSLLKSVHHLFSRCIPTLEDVEIGRYNVSSEDNPTTLNDLTVLRSDIKSLPITLQDIDIDQAANDNNIDRLNHALGSLLGLFEASVRDLSGLNAEAAIQQDTKCINLFPRLFTLRSLISNSAALLELQTSSSRLDKYVEFPPPGKTTAACRRLFESFRSTIMDIFPDGIRWWNAGSQLQEITDHEIDSIKDAYEFSKISSSLFRLLVSRITCEAKHVARLHLSGFHTGQLEMLLGTSDDDWIPASFTPSLSEDVAALGVLILELETNASAEWTDDDKDYETGTKSNVTRLCRILRDWKGELTDSYREVGSTCSRFEYLMENFDDPIEGFYHTNIDHDQRSLAILYKRIVNPLYQQLVSDFGIAERLFEGISSLSVPVRQKRVPTTGTLVLYDDVESIAPDNKSRYAEDLIKILDDGFLQNIKSLRTNLPPQGLAEKLKGIKTSERIRIAVLDTGIDMNDTMVKPAIKSRIKDMRSWVPSNDSCDDIFGHGTHVTRLLLRMAPAAEIYVAKITDNNTVHAENMTRIAEAINWALDKWNVHIISMSFGFESKNSAIDDAIDRAFKADKLMFAAASNEGGNKRKRCRPGRDSRVICIHACDGKGNKGDMNPSPEKKKDNFTALGVAVKSQWKRQVVYKSGTSFATPVAAAFAADILEFANLRCSLSYDQKKLLHRRDGMLAVFHAMSIERDGYDYLHPEHLWDRQDVTKAAKAIQDILELE